MLVVSAATHNGKETMQIILRLIGLSGVVLFGLLFAVTYSSPAVIEQSALGFVKHQIEKEVRATQHAAGQSAVVEQVLGLAARLGLEKEELQKGLSDGLPEKTASVVASMCGYDCERRMALSQSIASGYLERISSIQVAEDTLGQIIKGKYVEIVGNLKLDLRVFLGTNCVMFLFLLALSFLKPQAVTHLFLPGMLLLFSTLMSLLLYVYGQDWFYTILYNDYMGFTYLIYIAVIFAILSDIAFNRARVITEILNGIANTLGYTLSMVPC